MANQSKFRLEIVEVDPAVMLQSDYNFAAMNGYIRDIIPINDFDFTVKEKREGKNLYYIKEIDTKLKVGRDDFGYFYYQGGGIDSCKRYWMNVYKKCGGEEKRIYQCFFTQVDISYDLDECVAEIALQDQSHYNCINDNKSNKVNVVAFNNPPNASFPPYFKMVLGGHTYRSVDLWYAISQTIAALGGCCDVKAHCIGGNVVSDLFNWVDVGGFVTLQTSQPAPGTTNYVNPSQPGYWIHIACKSDIIDPAASNPATVLELSFEDIEKMMAEVFNMFWVLEFVNLAGGYYNVRFEHISWFARSANYDAMSVTNAPLNKFKNKIKIIKDDIPLQDTYKMMEAEDVDFVGEPIIYGENCSNRKKEERGYEYVTTDLNMIVNNSANVDPEGFVLVDLHISSGVPMPYATAGAISGVSKQNARLSWANLHADLHRHGRPVKSFTMNGAGTLALGPVYRKEQLDILTQMCCTDDYNKHESLVITEFGKGMIDEAEINYTKEIIKFKLRHE